ncbi:hypothetical protein ACROYT_G042877 [Oculina patagonica]
MPENRTNSFSVPEFFPPHFTPQVRFTHKRSTADEVSNGLDSSWSPRPSPTLAEVQSTMASLNLPGTSFGVLLPICLLAVFLSCVVCVYHWQSIRERRMDMEDERKRKRIVYDFDDGCALKTYKQINKSKVRMYPWKATRIQELPDVNNNDEFDIPFSPGVNRGAESYLSGGGRKTVTAGDLSGYRDRPDLKRTSIHSRTSDSKGEPSGSRYSSEAAFKMKQSSSWSADTTTKTCAIASSKISTGPNDEPECDVIREEAVHVTHFGLDGQVVSVETVNGSLLEYWV